MLAKISKIVFLIIVTELCLGGGGRLTAFGPVSLRMILFVIAMMISSIYFIKGENIPKNSWRLLALFLITMLIGISIGLINHNPLPMMWEDVKPLSYFFMLIFFSLSIALEEIQSAVKIVKTCSIIMALVFVVALFLIHSDSIPFLSFYAITEKSQEFFYRGELSFFYKGFLFFGVGLIFFYFSRAKGKYFFITVLSLAILLSVTRGLLFSLALTAAVYFFWQRKYSFSLSSVALAVVVLVWGNKFTINVSRWIDSIGTEKSYEKSSPDLFGGREYSDVSRLDQVQEVADQVSIPSVIVGHGFGRGIPSRPVHMEIAYLEIFHKQGLIGLLFWSIVALTIYKRYKSSDQSLNANAFFYSSIFVFVESATNQYFNNPIGMSVLLISMVCLDKMKR